MVTIPFLKKMQLPKLNLGFGTGSAGYVGIDVGASSVKVVELRKEKDRAVLKSYGELKTAVFQENCGRNIRNGRFFALS